MRAAARLDAELAQNLHSRRGKTAHGGPAPAHGGVMRKSGLGAVGACALLFATGCATSGRVDEIEGRVQNLESRVDALDQRFSDVESRAQAAESAAQRAAEEARNAAQRADDAARRADAMFKKSVSK